MTTPKATPKKSKAKLQASKALRELRVRLQETQESFARSLGVNVLTVARWERRQSPPGIILLRLMEIAERYHAMDLASMFCDALNDLPPRIVEDLEQERNRWHTIFHSLHELFEEAEELSQEMHPAAKRIQDHLADIHRAAKEAKDWSWRNQ